MSDSLQRLQKTLGYEFSDQGLLQLALSHRSCGARNNERLEFLGDSVLNHVITEALFEAFPLAREGELSRMRASLVTGETLAKVAREFALGEYIRLGSGEKKSGGHRRDSIQADCLEALIGAMLLDSDIGQCRSRVLAWFAQRLETISPELTEKDAKTQLQEFLQGRGKALPEYSLLRVEGEDHNQEFTVQCRVSGHESAFEGVGSSRRKAEQAAAQAALELLND